MTVLRRKRQNGRNNGNFKAFQMADTREKFVPMTFLAQRDATSFTPATLSPSEDEIYGLDHKSHHGFYQQQQH
jgi:hypothetical protein